MKRTLLVMLALWHVLPASARMFVSSVPQDAPRLPSVAPADAGAGGRARMLVLRRTDPATIDDQTLHEIGLLLESTDPVDVSYAVRAMADVGPRARPYTRRLQQIVSEEHCNMIGRGTADWAAIALNKIGIPARPSACLAWTKK